MWHQQMRAILLPTRCFTPSFAVSNHLKTNVSFSCRYASHSSDIAVHSFSQSIPLIQIRGTGYRRRSGQLQMIDWSHCGSFLDTLAQTIISGSELGSSRTSHYRNNQLKIKDDLSKTTRRRGHHRSKAVTAKQHASSPRVHSSHRSSNPSRNPNRPSHLSRNTS